MNRRDHHVSPMAPRLLFVWRPFVTGRGALAHFQNLDDSAHALQQQLNTRLEDIPAYVQSIQEKQKQPEKQVKQLRMKMSSDGSRD